jgi:hypothetical protein
VPAVLDITGRMTSAGRFKNLGEEAQRANCLRGDIELGGGYREEPTAYRGNHYVEVYIVQNGRCVAMDRQRVRIV